MTSEEEKQLVRYWYESVLSGSSPSSAAVHASDRHQPQKRIAELFSEDYQNHVVPGPPDGWKPGLDGARQVLSLYRSSFPDLAVQILDQVVEGEKIVTHYVVTATHTGKPFFGMPSSGKQYRVSGTGIDRVTNGKIAESWGNWDSQELMKQMGILPPEGQVR